MMYSFMIPRGGLCEVDHVTILMNGRTIKIKKGAEYVVREKGEWIMNRDGSCTCKKCRRTTNDAWDFDGCFNFCPNCGADMRKGENG